ncbi:hypothetical protein JCM18918_3146 [Cutibacterium acnes JCM 18918]|nr:hypothetical protein JCM18918_3146 [Cutibacterium acnes JCM 18918]
MRLLVEIEARHPEVTCPSSSPSSPYWLRSLVTGMRSKKRVRSAHKSYLALEHWTGLHNVGPS